MSIMYLDILQEEKITAFYIIISSCRITQEFLLLLYLIERQEYLM